MAKCRFPVFFVVAEMFSENADGYISGNETWCMLCEIGLTAELEASEDGK